MDSLKNITHKLKQTISEFNIFELETVRLENFDVHKAIISTRLYIILLISLLAALTIYTTLDGSSQNILIRNPSQSDFENLYSKFPNTLSCPCQDITIPYKSFISVNIDYHPVCSSIFISDIWIDGLFHSNMSYYYPLDFRSSGSGQFQILSSLCFLAKKFVNDAIDDFLSDAFLTPFVLSSYFLDIQSQSESLILRISTNNDFQQLIQLIRTTSFSNQLQPALQTASIFKIVIYNEVDITTDNKMNPFSSSDNTVCYCGVESTCSSSVCGFFDLFVHDVGGNYTSTMSLMDVVPGFVVGCYALESLLQSTFECFYDSLCLNVILNYFPHINRNNIQPLHINQTQYSYDTNISTLVSNLFITNWTLLTSFTQYYKKCAPILCQYTLWKRNNAIYVITKLLGIYGGLAIVLRFCVPRIIMWKYQSSNIRRRNSIQIRMTHLFRLAQSSFSEQLKNLNLFDSNLARNDPYEIKTLIIATRVYILLICLSIIILIIYGSTNIRTQTFTIQNPSQTTFEQLHAKYSSHLQCPCQQIAIQYDKFLSLSPQYHPICTSIFTSNELLHETGNLLWPNYVFIYQDFRYVGEQILFTLQTLCLLAETTIFNAWFNFKQSSYINKQVIPEKEMFAYVHKRLNDFKSNTIAQFQKNLALIQFHSMNLYAVGSQNAKLATSDTLNSSKSIVDFYYQSRNWSGCSCALNDHCIDQIGFYDYPQAPSPYPNSLIFNVPGLYVGCFTIQSVLQSSLECFFNQTCIDSILIQIGFVGFIQVDNLQANATRFPPKTAVQVLVDELMVEQWGDQITYKQYYEQCTPQLCTYTLTQHNNIPYIITLLIALFGGLSMVLKTIVPFIVRRIRNRYRTKVNPMTRPTLINHLRLTRKQLWMQMKEFNLFETELSWNDEHRRIKEIWITRIYLLLLIIGVIILISFTSILDETEYIKIFHPSQTTFNQLRLNPIHSTSLECPCQNLTIAYSSFISINPSFHQFCSSDFIDVNSGWINMLYSYGIDEEHPYDDFRLFALPQFRTLSSLCILANQTWTHSFNLFTSQTLITNQVKSEETIQIQAQLAINQFRLSTSRTFVRTLDFIGRMAQGNGIVSAIQSNYYFHSLNKTRGSSLWAMPRSYGDENNCSCVTNSLCTLPAVINDTFIPGFRIGCYVLDALLQSTLECLYNVTCIDTIKYLYDTENIQVHPLDPDLSSPNETVQSLANILFVDQWKTNISYEQYYRTCSPLFCTYSINQRVSLIYTITTIIGLYGGLTITLKLITPFLINIGHFIIIHRRQRVVHAIIIRPIVQ